MNEGLIGLAVVEAIKAKSWWYRNCKVQRKKKAKVCETCPFRKLIEYHENHVAAKVI